MTSYSVYVQAHGSPSEEQLTAFTDAMPGDAVVSGGPDHPTWSVTFTVEAAEVGDAVRKAVGIFYPAVVSHNTAGTATFYNMPGLPMDHMRLVPDD